MPRHFNSRPSARGDEEAHQRAREAHISIHAPPRGATVTSISSFKPRSEFQFTPLREGRRARLCQSPASYQFQFTPLREGRPPFFVAVFGLSHFNSRPSARGDASARNVPRKPLISIHAPPRGATKGNVIADERYIISIHAPPRGATATRRGFLTPVLFQFTPLREGRRLAGSPCDVSRHHFNSRPSARGDDGERVRFAAWCYFNSRPSARGDSHFPSSTTERGVFQFTPLREGRPSPSPAMPVKFFDFNSRPSARGDVSDCSIADISTISIHAPPRGATSHPVIFPSAALFQFTPLREGRRWRPRSRSQADRISIHAPPRGATLSVPSKNTIFPISIHAPPRGATGSVSVSTYTANISIHAPPRGATFRFAGNRGSLMFPFQFTPLREGRQQLLETPSPAHRFQFTPLREGRLCRCLLR